MVILPFTLLFLAALLAVAFIAHVVKVRRKANHQAREHIGHASSIYPEVWLGEPKL